MVIKKVAQNLYINYKDIGSSKKINYGDINGI